MGGVLLNICQKRVPPTHASQFESQSRLGIQTVGLLLLWFPFQTLTRRSGFMLGDEKENRTCAKVKHKYMDHGHGSFDKKSYHGCLHTLSYVAAPRQEGSNSACVI